MRVTCDCGMTTNFVEIDGVIRRDGRFHGGNDTVGLICHNCNRQLKAPLKPIETKNPVNNVEPGKPKPKKIRGKK